MFETERVDGVHMQTAIQRSLPYSQSTIGRLGCNYMRLACCALIDSNELRSGKDVQLDWDLDLVDWVPECRLKLAQRIVSKRMSMRELLADLDALKEVYATLMIYDTNYCPIGNAGGVWCSMRSRIEAVLPEHLHHRTAEESDSSDS
jgi:hypothetical protein